MSRASSCEFARRGTFTNRVHLEFVAGLIAPRGWDFMREPSLGVYDGQALQGAYVFHDWNPEAGTMCMSAAGRKGWLTQESIYKAHRYIFEEVGCQAAVLQVSERNGHMCKTARHFGYEGTRVPRLRGRDEAEIIFVLPVETWRASKFTRRAEARYNCGELLAC